MYSEGLELRSAEREQWQGERTTAGRKSEWWIVGSSLTELSIICFSLLRSNVLTATYCRAATVSASPFIRKKATLNRSLFVRIKGLEPPRLSASDPKSDVATTYTISAGSITLGNHRGARLFIIKRCKGIKLLQYMKQLLHFFILFFAARHRRRALLRTTCRVAYRAKHAV